MTRVVIATPGLTDEIGGPAYSVRRTHEDLCLASVQSRLLTKRAERGSVGMGEWTARGLTNAEILHNFGVWTPFNHRASTWARHAGVPEILCPMGMLEPWSLAQKRLKKRLAWLLYQRRDLEGAAALHATASTEAEHLRALGMKNPIAVIPHGIDLPLDNPRDRRPCHDGGETTLLFLSRIHPKKGLLELVEACSSLRQRAGWRLVVAGPDTVKHQAVVSSAVKRAGLEDRVKFVGPAWGEAKRKLFLAADVFVLPTHSENFGVVIGEALAHGLPVITTTGAPWAELREFGCGWWVTMDKDAISDAIREALVMPKTLLAQMGARGRSLVQERYSWRAATERHIALYEWVLGRGTRPIFVK